MIRPSAQLTAIDKILDDINRPHHPVEFIVGDARRALLRLREEIAKSASGDDDYTLECLLDQVDCEVSRELYGDDADGNRGAYMTTVELLTDSATIEGLAGDEVVGLFSGRWSGDQGGALDVIFTLSKYDGDLATYRVESAGCAVFG